VQKRVWGERKGLISSLKGQDGHFLEKKRCSPVRGSVANSEVGPGSRPNNKRIKKRKRECLPLKCMYWGQVPEKGQTIRPRKGRKKEEEEMEKR